MERGDSDDGNDYDGNGKETEEMNFPSDHRRYVSSPIIPCKSENPEQ